MLIGHELGEPVNVAAVDRVDETDYGCDGWKRLGSHSSKVSRAALRRRSHLAQKYSADERPA